MPFQKGFTPWNKGKKTGIVPKTAFVKNDPRLMGSKSALGYRHTTKAKERIGEAVKQQWASEERKGYPCGEKTKEKMSIAKRGQTPKNIKLFTENGKLTRFKEGHISWHKGKVGVYSKKTLRKMAEARQKRFLSGEPTSIEKKLYDELKSRGILFEKQRLINGRFLVDAYIPSLNLVIEADGDYHHSLPDVVKKDKTKNAYLGACGFNMLRITGTEIRNGSFMKKLDERMVN